MKKEASPTESQEAKILAWMKQGKYLTPMVALKEFGCFRLGARLFNLKRDHKDLIFVTDMVTDEKTEKRYASYRIEGVAPAPKTERAMKGKSVIQFSKDILSIHGQERLF
jgi:hypothetical protein